MSALLIGTGAFAQGVDCSTAEVIGEGTFTVTGLNSGAGASNNCFGSGGTDANWYSFTPTCDGTINVSSSGSGVDTRLSIYSGGCAALTCEQSSDDANGLTSTVSNMAVTAGSEYLIEWDDRWSSNGFDWSLTYSPAVQLPGVAPSNILALSANVTWTAFAAETDWNVEYGVAGFTIGAGTQVAVTPLPTISLASLNPETTYDIYVSLPGDPCSATLISFTTLPLCPTPNTIATTTGALDAQITWSAGGIETNWNVEYGSVGFPLGSGTTVPTTLTTEDISGLNQLTCYHYYVQANCVAVGATSLWVGPMEFCTIATCPEPAGLSSNVVSPDSVEIMWTSNGGETEWTISYGTPGFAAGSDMELVTSSNPDTLFGLASDTEYEYYVQANCGATDASVWVGPMTFTTSISCAEVSGVSLTSVDVTTADFTWIAGGTETSWNVEYGMNGFMPGSGTSSVETTNSVSLTGLTSYTDYSFYVQAICGAGDLAQWVGPLNFTTVASCPQPTNLNAINISNSSANLIFQAGGSESEWNIEWGVPGFVAGNSEETGMIGNTTDNPYYATGLNASSSYEYYVQASCGTGDESVWVGPYPFNTLLSNDLVCNAIDLTTDGTVVSYINIGATLNGDNVLPTSDWLVDAAITAPVWFSFVAPASGNVTVSTANDVTVANGSRTEIAIYSANDCANFGTYALLGANGDKVNGVVGSEVSACGLTTGTTYYVMLEAFSDLTSWTQVPAFQGIFGISVEAVTAVEAGNAVAGTSCANNAGNLFDVIEGYSHDNGTWYFPSATAIGAQGFASNDGYIALTGLDADTEYTFDYVVNIGCAADTVSTSYTWVQQPSAGNDGTVTTCPNTDVLLIQELSGTVTFGGTWSDDDNATGLINGIVNTVNIIPGTYNFSYVVENGVCSDTAIVAVTVNSCLGVEANEVSTLEVYPNPVVNVLTIANLNVDGNATITLLNVQGKVVYTTTVSNVNGNYELDLSKFENGVYIIEVTSELTTQNVRVVKH